MKWKKIWKIKEEISNRKDYRKILQKDWLEENEKGIKQLDEWTNLKCREILFDIELVNTNVFYVFFCKTFF